jgi:putative Ca2+/H+ antiporter (TMEM165/GDT1 family)
LNGYRRRCGRNDQQHVIAGITEWRFGAVVLVAFWTVLVAELIGDRTIYTVTSLALRFRASVVIGAMVLAFGGKMLAAVLLGKVLAQIPHLWTAVLSASAFFATALFIWLRGPEPIREGRLPGDRWPRAALIAFAALFFAEWGDPGQIATAALTMQSHCAAAAWLGGTLAMMTKGGLAIVIGLRLRDRLPIPILRTLACASCCVLGVVALSGVVLPGPG